MGINLQNFYYKLKNNQNYKLKAFVYAFVIASFFFIPFIAYGKGYFTYYGDFNSQQIAFYKMMHDAVKSGNFMWNNFTDLGVNTIGSYTFYLLGSPFFWLTIPFPSSFVPHLMAPLLILKLACCALTAYIYLKRYVKNQNFALLGALMYAFSSFSIYNIFFNHFHDAMVFFPLLLFALDEYVETGKKGLIYLMSFICCIVNYYFFIAEAVFCIIYIFVRMAFGSYKLNLKKFAWLVLEVVLGVLTSSILLVPTIFSITQNYRVSEHLTGWDNYMFSKNTQRYVLILESFFFPPDIPARPNFAPDSNAKWASVAAWIPLIGMTGVFAFFREKKKNWLKYLLIILFICCLVPILNSMFQLFNSAYYARWYFMLILMMILATVIMLDTRKLKFWKKPIIYSIIVICIFALPIGLTLKESDTGFKLGLEEYPDRFWIYVAIALFSIAIFTFCLGFVRNKTYFSKMLLAGFAIVTIIYSTYVISLGTNIGLSDAKFMNPNCLNPPQSLSQLPNKDNQVYRIDSMTSIDNINMFWGVMGIQAFHSIVPGSIMDFYPTVGVERSVGSRPETDVYGIRGLLSCKWLFDEIDDNKNFAATTNSTPKMPGWQYYGVMNGCYVWENKYFIPFGFSYDSYITKDEYNSIDEEQRHLALLKAIVLEGDSVDRNLDILAHDDTSNFTFDQENYFKDCEKLKSSSCSSFKTDNFGFSASFENKDNKDKLVFFSIPYEKGWSATVNNSPAIIEKTNIGFMAVRVPANTTSNIRFNYTTPGLKLGVIISAIALICFVLIIIFAKKYKPKN